ncbi:dual specificity protein phosphatase family protein [Vitiosangium sp. GDMCC 1.1324]|uniref:protein-tyrosine phosphatase family protein n=1 Tax=Vitiosangium sp. (strain GDMCC 1.1324) TaxID=2138576 RepID=UPI000D3AFFE8|nr:dual specificity protein phosphatase [Vitiosangium sp. GDMCC 1.1324]PTL81973.1 protein phosphatase [Vitiosangium sp. GDMCC 1.1324]
MVQHSWALNLDWVTPELAVGGRFPIEAAEHLARRLSIRHIVDVRREACDNERVLREHGITLLHLPTEDLCSIRRQMLDQGVQWVHGHLSQGHKVYIHCEHGIGRSALLALCVLVELGHAPLEALSLAKRARPRVSPSPEQLETFMLWAEERRVTRSLPWSTPSFDELADLAYSHLRPSPSVG